MALGANERQRSAVPLQDPDGRLIVVGPDGVPISGGAGGGGADPLSDGSDAGALPTKTLWVAGADGTVLRGLRVDASGRARVVVEGTPAVSVSNFPGSQAVTGPLTDAQLRASNVPVSGPITDTQLRAAAVPVSGPLTDTQLRASAVPVTDSRLPVALDADGGLKSHIQNTVPVSGTFFQATQPVSLSAVPTVTEKQDQPAGTTATWTSATALNTALTNNSVAGYGTANVSIQVPSTVTGGVITLEVSDDGTVWYQAGSVRVDNGLQENVVNLALTPGQASNRMYSISVDAMTNIRARLSTVIAGTGNVVVRITLVAGGIEPFVAQRSRKVATYRASFRAASRPYAISNTFVANTRKQFATIHHPVAATRTVRLRHVWFEVTNTTVAGAIVVEFVRITSAPVTGNPTITPALADSGDIAAEATCLALPTTAATEAAVPYASEVWNLSVSAAASGTVPQNPYTKVDLLAANPNYDDEGKLPSIRAGVLEGWAVTVDSLAATTLSANVWIEFTEESA